MPKKSLTFQSLESYVVKSSELILTYILIYGEQALCKSTSSKLLFLEVQTAPTGLISHPTAEPNLNFTKGSAFWGEEEQEQEV